jgi:hypothetical protein
LIFHLGSNELYNAKQDLTRQSVPVFPAEVLDIILRNSITKFQNLTKLRLVCREFAELMIFDPRFTQLVSSELQLCVGNIILLRNGGMVCDVLVPNNFKQPYSRLVLGRLGIQVPFQELCAAGDLSLPIKEMYLSPKSNEYLRTVLTNITQSLPRNQFSEISLIIDAGVYDKENWLDEYLKDESNRNEIDIQFSRVRLFDRFSNSLSKETVNRRSDWLAQCCHSGYLKSLMLNRDLFQSFRSSLLEQLASSLIEICIYNIRSFLSPVTLTITEKFSTESSTLERLTLCELNKLSLNFLDFSRLNTVPNLKELTLKFNLSFVEEQLKSVEYDDSEENKLTRITTFKLIYLFQKILGAEYEFDRFIPLFRLIPNVETIVFNTNSLRGISLLLKGFPSPPVQELILFPKLKHLNVFFYSIPHLKYPLLKDAVRDLLNRLKLRNADLHEPIMVQIGINDSINFPEIVTFMMAIIEDIPTPQVIGFHFIISSLRTTVEISNLTDDLIKPLFYAFAQSDLPNMQLSVYSTSDVNANESEVKKIQQIFESFDSDFFTDNVLIPGGDTIRLSTQKWECPCLNPLAVKVMVFSKIFEWNREKHLSQCGKKHFQFKGHFGNEEPF